MNRAQRSKKTAQKMQVQRERIAAVSRGRAQELAAILRTKVETEDVPWHLSECLKKIDEAAADGKHSVYVQLRCFQGDSDRSGYPWEHLCEGVKQLLVAEGYLAQKKVQYNEVDTDSGQGGDTDVGVTISWE